MQDPVFRFEFSKPELGWGGVCHTGDRLWVMESGPWWLERELDAVPDGVAVVSEGDDGVIYRVVDRVRAAPLQVDELVCVDADGTISLLREVWPCQAPHVVLNTLRWGERR